MEAIFEVGKGLTYLLYVYWPLTSLLFMLGLLLILVLLCKGLEWSDDFADRYIYRIYDDEDDY